MSLTFNATLKGIFGQKADDLKPVFHLPAILWKQPIDLFLKGGLGLLPWPPCASCPEANR